MRVLKFGGSSVGTPERIKKVVELVVASQQQNQSICVVVSAFGGVTDEIIELSALAAEGDKTYHARFKELETRHIAAVEELIPGNRRSLTLETVKQWLEELKDVLHGVFLVRECSARTQDYLMSFGERFSAFVISESVLGAGIDASYVDARELIVTDASHGEARVEAAQTEANIKTFFKSPKSVSVVTGFIAASTDGKTTTLGRGGSDYTAAILGSALDADLIEIWSDVDGMMTADPRKVQKAFPLQSVTYNEAMELSHFGAAVIYPPTMQPALDRCIPISIRNTFNPSAPGTLIQKDKVDLEYMVTGVSSIPSIALLRLQGPGMVGVPGISMRLFGALANNEISVILITQASSEHTICFAVNPQSGAKAKRIIESEFKLEISAGLVDPVVVETEHAIVSVVGENMRQRPGIASKVFGGLARNGINVVAIAQGSSELNISVVVSSSDERKSLNVLHDEFFLSGSRAVNVFMVGTGLIGGTLLKQFQSHREELLKQHALDLRLVGVSNTRACVVETRGLDFEQVESALNSAGSGAGAAELVKRMAELNLPNTVFVDCTASEQVTELYPDVLKQSVSIVTPNKKAQSGEFKDYRALLDLARLRNASFLYETSVGAGLPVISTLRDLLKSGDQIIRIEAVLSGTLSYIFNSFTGEKPFSAIVSEARQRGFTEPDPRDDLNGLDVARKILILAREAGVSLEPSAVEVENLVPQELRETESVDEFLNQLANFDDHFHSLLSEAKSNGAKLCYIASLQDGKAQVSLQAVEASHPFYSLSGSDNIISFTSQRYSERPLVVKGPGAGAEVTAAGVFADIIRLAG